MISAVIELGERRVHEVMVPRTDMTALPVTASMDEAIDTFIQRGPQPHPGLQEVDRRDRRRALRQGPAAVPQGRRQKPDLRKLLRAPLFVPESMSIDDLLHKLQGRKVHLAIVLDEYGGTAGMVTIEDLLEEIVGDIQDEYDVEEPMTVRLSDDEARVDGRARSTTWPSCSTWTWAGSRTPTSTTRSAGSSTTASAAFRGPATRSSWPSSGLTLTVETDRRPPRGQGPGGPRSRSDHGEDDDGSGGESTKGAAR